MFIFYVIALYTLHLGVTPIDYQCKEQNNDVDWFFVYKLPGGKSSHHLIPNAATDWSAVANIDDQQKPMHSTMNLYIASQNKPNTNIVAYSNYPPHFKFELPMSPGKGVIMAEDNNKGFWLVHTAKYFPNLALAIGDLFSNEKTTKEAAAFLCMSYSDVNLRAIAKIIDYEQPIVFFAQKSATVPALYDSTEIQKLVNGLHTYQPTAYASGDGVATLTAPGTVKIFASAPVAYSSGPITVKDTVIPIGEDSARWSVPKSDSDFICLSNTGRTANDAKYGASVACVLSKEAADLFRKMITTKNLDACT
ncbi:deoxyribonuclease II [Trichinella nativa]|uniref:Deoxyribonuclease II n=1 Tax=Trichinella nativa TaxID=6335 RepID=A0A1Y3EXM9_9BILA|nr:deoxyribonuclease II [Trichinella nativa]